MKAWIDEYSTWILETDPKTLCAEFEPMLKEAGFGVLNFMDHHFSPQGYTAIWLIEESHFAIHTFPEENKTYIQLSSCNREMYFRFIELMKGYEKK